MIISNSLKVVICTPTKTGTESLMHTLTLNPAFKYVLPKHGIEYPMKAGWRRVLLVRNPYARLRSMYMWAIAHAGTKGHNFATKHCRAADGSWCSFDQFLEFHQTIDHPTWGWNYSKISEAFKNTEVWRLENIDTHIEEFANVPGFPRCGSCYKPQLVMANAGRSHLYWVRHKMPPTHFSAKAKKIVRDWVVPDCNAFGYEVQK